MVVEFSLGVSRQIDFGKWILRSTDGVTVAASAELVQHLDTQDFRDNILPKYLEMGIPLEAVLVYNPNNKKGAKTPPLSRLFTVEADAVKAGIDVVALESLLAGFEGKTAAEKLQTAGKQGLVVVVDKPTEKTETKKTKKV